MNPKAHRVFNFFILLALLHGLGACRTYYQKSHAFQEYLRQGNMEKALKSMKDDGRGEKGKNRFLYFVNKGWVYRMLDRYEESNELFQQADIYLEDFHKKFGLEALTLISNPNIKPYAPEDFEKIFVNYYKALNYLGKGQQEEALVECKRINLQLQQLNDKYKDHKNRYQQDAFAHLMMGLIYEQSNDWNNAFIAYRNAYDVYKTDYAANFGVEPPEQLKQDILRTAYLMGFTEDLRHYENAFGMKYRHNEHAGGELVLIWHNGFGPVKSEWSINFSVSEGQGGWVQFVNDEYGFSFPFYIGDKSEEEKSAFAKLHFMRVAFPKYLERKPVFNSGRLIAGNKSYPLQRVENINAIAFKTLKDRMIREISNSLMRLATKKVVETVTRKQNEDVGAVLGLVNALTEKADTRNWQTLPHEIYYRRIPLPQGKNSIRLELSGDTQSTRHEFAVNIQKNRLHFLTYRSIESHPPNQQTDW